MGDTMSIEMRHIKKSYGGQTVLADFSLSIPEGGMLCLMGPSGSGKTTVLRILAGLTKPDAGEVDGLRGKKVAMVFQENRLLEWADAFANVELVLGQADVERIVAGMGSGQGRQHMAGEVSGQKGQHMAGEVSGQGERHMAGMVSGQGEQHVTGIPQPQKNLNAHRKKAALRAFLRAEFAAVGLHDYEGKPVSQLSGGMKRRIAVVRAVCAAGGLLLLDEPFTGLDEGTKEQVIHYIKDRAAGRTVVVVTHDAQDAVQMGAKVKEVKACSAVMEHV